LHISEIDFVLHSGSNEQSWIYALYIILDTSNCKATLRRDVGTDYET